MKKSCLFKDFKLMSTRINTIRAFQEILQITTFTNLLLIIIINMRKYKKKFKQMNNKKIQVFKVFLLYQVFKF